MTLVVFDEYSYYQDPIVLNFEVANGDAISLQLDG